MRSKAIKAFFRRQYRALSCCDRSQSN